MSELIHNQNTNIIEADYLIDSLEEDAAYEAAYAQVQKDRLSEYLERATKQEKIEADPRLDEIDPVGSRSGFKYFRIDQEDGTIQEGDRKLHWLIELPDGRVVTVTCPSMNGAQSAVDIGVPNGEILTNIEKPDVDTQPSFFVRGSWSINTSAGFIRRDKIEDKSLSAFGDEGVIANPDDYMIRESSNGVQVWKVSPEEGNGQA